MIAENVHGTALLVGSSGILIRGRAQAGKSSLCISLLRRAQSLSLSAALVADDRVDLASESDTVVMSAPPILKGLIEIAGVGIVREAVVDSAPLTLVVDLVATADLTRLPEKVMQNAVLLDRAFRRITLPERDAAFAADVILSLLISNPPRPS